MKFLELFYIFCFFQSVIVALALIRLKGKKLPNRLLAIHVIIWGLMCFYRFTVFQSKEFILDYHFILRFNHVVELLMFVFVYLYIKYVTNGYQHFRKTDYLHFIPALIAFILLLPFFILSGQEKVDLILSKQSNYQQILSDIFYYTSLIQGIVYCTWSIKCINFYHKKVKEHFSNIEKRTIYWLQTILSVVLSFLIIGPLASTFFPNRVGHFIFNLLYIVIGGSIYIISYYMLTMNHLFLESNELEYADENATIKENKNLSNNDALNISNTQMDPEYSQIIIQKLQNVMSQEKLYLFHDLNLDTVAQRISVPRHHISNVLNKSLNTNFFDYINKFRVEEAKRKIKDETLKNYTLIALGSEAGFNSKASFYRNFKRYENMTPLEYKQLIDSNK